MGNFSRRNFLQSSAILPFAFKDFCQSVAKPTPLLSFSTLGCPEWDFTKVLEFAVSNHYNGIELRGIKGQLNLPECNEFNSPVHIAETKKIIADKGLKIVDLGSSTELHHTESDGRQKQLDSGKRFIDLAAAINCPYIRVFPNKLPDGDERKKVIDLIISGLIELGDYAGKTGVTVLMESHGDAVKTEELKYIMHNAENSRTGLVWDIVNMWAVTKLPPAEVYAQLKKYIRHTHIKDLQFNGDKIKYVLLGTGVTPIFDAIDLLYKDGYKGYYSFEWEKLWHPEIDAPEIALADYPKKMRAHFKQF
ncbi:MAG TPA: sugar phosphate isomerase/epimerase family protein [Flavisolibacter sp.]|nr:sugar phosphate isomerase/epimerase family protein [Flavisolibacter sp.]